MEKINITGVNQNIIYEKLPNGLEVYLIPNNSVKNFYMTFNTRFGSINTEFKKEKDRRFIKIPNGSAHFLEHLTFKMPEGDASTYFANLGSFCNAYTSFRITCYEVYAYELFKENLEYLLDYVQTPFYNQKLVDGEKGIITEEIKMYEDDPIANMSSEINLATFQNDKRKYMVSGSKEDIKNITVKDIENAYNTFYHPSNMFVVITGNFNAEEALAIISENQARKNFSEPFKIINKKITEPVKVQTHYTEITGNVKIPKVCLGIKVPLKNFKQFNIDDSTRNVYISMIINSMFGRSSEIKERLASGNIITDGLLVERFFTEDYLIINILAETPYPKRYISLMEEELKKIDITENDLARKSKVAISNLILSYDDIEQTNASLQSDIINYGKVIDNFYDIYNNLDIKLAKQIAKKITTKETSIVVLNPQED